MKTHSTKPDEITRQWHVIDASTKPLGRVATEVAYLLRGKHKPNYAPHLDMGDYVVVVNASRIQVTGRKLLQKLYYRHSGYPGGLRSVWLEKLLQTKPERVMEHAVRGMLPKTKLGREMYRKLRVYAGPTHPHQAQVVGSERAHEARTAPAATVSAPVAPRETREEATAAVASTAPVSTPAPTAPATAAPETAPPAASTPEPRATVEQPARAEAKTPEEEPRPRTESATESEE